MFQLTDEEGRALRSYFATSNSVGPASPACACALELISEGHEELVVQGAAGAQVVHVDATLVSTLQNT